MGKEDLQIKEGAEELPDSWWYRVYLAVVFNAVLAIAALWIFSWYFSR
jgi:hypothetical protein